MTKGDIVGIEKVGDRMYRVGIESTCQAYVIQGGSGTFAIVAEDGCASGLFARVYENLADLNAQLLEYDWELPLVESTGSESESYGGIRVSKDFMEAVAKCLVLV